MDDDDEGEQLAALLLGRRTYQEFAASWPLVGDDNPVAERFNRVPKYVASRTLQTATLGEPGWHNSSVLDGDVVDAVAGLKLAETTTSPGGVTMSTYTRAGDLQTGFYGAEFDN